MTDYVTINGRKFRKGYTTGSCAAAASKAAVAMLLSGCAVESVDIETPSGFKLKLPVTDIRFLNGSVKCSVVKDGGDDPDITTGLKVFAEVKFGTGRGININSAEGIGIVTLPGLKVKVGEPAINPVPMKMILNEVGKILPDERSVEITLSVPGGEEVALKTYNPRLGIMGGISILGTSGIVTPMSEEAWKESIALELSIAAGRGFKEIVYTFGNYGESFSVNNMGINKDRIIKTSNFIGYMLDKALDFEIEKILLVGHMGKLVKVAAGIFHTHSRVADARMEILAAYAAVEGASGDVVKNILQCTTTDAAAAIIKDNKLEGVFGKIVSNSSRRCSEYLFNKIRVGTVLFNENNTFLSLDECAKEILREIGGTYK